MHSDLGSGSQTNTRPPAGNLDLIDTGLFSLELKLETIAEREARTLHTHVEAKPLEKRRKHLLCAVRDVASYFTTPICDALAALAKHCHGDSDSERLDAASNELKKHLRGYAAGTLSRTALQVLSEGETTRSEWRAPRWAVNWSLHSIARRLIGTPDCLIGTATEEETSEAQASVAGILQEGIDNALLTALADLTVNLTNPTHKQRRIRGRRHSLSNTDLQPKNLSIIRDALSLRLKGLPYCKYLKEKGAKTPLHWRKHGCPEEYPAAYSSLEWRKHIWNEKNLAKRRHSSNS